MNNYIAYLKSNIYTILHEWYQGELLPTPERDITFVETRTHPTTREQIAIYRLRGLQWENAFEPIDYNPADELPPDFPPPGSWEPALIEICLNTKGEVVDINSIGESLVSFGNGFVSVSKPELPI